MPAPLETPSLLETQRALCAQLFGADAPSAGDASALAASWQSEPGLALRLSIYRNTCVSTLVNALRLSFPAVQRLVGCEFFEAAAQQFVRDQLPASAYLNDYGADFPPFLREFPAAAALAYLGDVAQLEWAVNLALHASEVPALDLARLAALSQAQLARVSFVAHPGMSLLRSQTPADLIWRAVLDQDDAAMASIDLASGPVWLLVERDATGLQVRRLAESAWRFTARLCAGLELHSALADDSNEEINAALADHLSSGRLIDFRLADGDTEATTASKSRGGP
jgi:hypothetical protein